MKYHFCTIASPDYLPFVQTLCYSLNKQSSDTVLHVLLTANDKPDAVGGALHYYVPGDLPGESVKEIVHKYRLNNDHLRWALKPAFLSHLLAELDKVIYLDNDIYFYKPFDFLFEQLDQCSLLLTPHYFPFYPYPNEELFKSNYQIGLFNAGFIGASKKANSILKWWSDVCLHNIENNFCEGFFVDQRYLDLSIIIDEGVRILRHPGCNVGSWNMHQSKRSDVNGEILIEGRFPIVFIHFNNETIKHILIGNDRLLTAYYKEYENAFCISGHKLNEFKNYTPKLHPLAQIKRRMRLRTRIKGMFFRLYQKL